MFVDNRSSKYVANFCEEATVTTESGTELLDLEKFDNTITENINVQKAAAKFKSPTDIGGLRIDTHQQNNRSHFMQRSGLTCLQDIC